MRRMAAIPSSTPRVGRPPLTQELAEEIAGYVRQGLPLPEIVQEMKGRVGHNKVYEIARSMKFAPAPSTDGSPDTDATGEVA